MSKFLRIDNYSNFFKYDFMRKFQKKLTKGKSYGRREKT